MEEFSLENGMIRIEFHGTISELEKRDVEEWLFLLLRKHTRRCVTATATAVFTLEKSASELRPPAPPVEMKPDSGLNPPLDSAAAVIDFIAKRLETVTEVAIRDVQGAPEHKAAIRAWAGRPQSPYEFRGKSPHGPEAVRRRAVPAIAQKLVGQSATPQASGNITERTVLERLLALMPAKGNTVENLAECFNPGEPLKLAKTIVRSDRRFAPAQLGKGARRVEA